MGRFVVDEWRGRRETRDMILNMGKYGNHNKHFERPFDTDEDVVSYLRAEGLEIDVPSDSDSPHGRLVVLLASAGYSTFEPFGGLENPGPVEAKTFRGSFSPWGALSCIWAAFRAGTIEDVSAALSSDMFRRSCGSYESAATVPLPNHHAPNASFTAPRGSRFEGAG